MVKKVTEVILRIMGYLAAMGMCVFFALYMSAYAGWTFFYVLAAAPLFSFAVTALTAAMKSIVISTDVSGSMVYKNETLTLKISLKNRSFFPVPAAVIKIRGCEGFVPEKKSLLYSVSVAPRRTAEFEVRFKATMWGAAQIGVEKASLSDFLHFISVPLYKEKGGEKYFHTIKVFPDIPDIPSDTPLIKTAAESVRYSDDSEDTKETDSAGYFGGMPGYTHREYEPGDPVRRINWKLSSKRDIYMVRLDDEIESMRQVIVLDSRGGSRRNNELAVEGMLAAVFSLFRLGFDVSVWINSKDGFILSEISDYGDVTALQTSLADYSFTNDTAVTRIPSDSLSGKNHSGIMFYTPNADFRLVSEAESAAGYGINIVPVIAGEASALPAPYWLLNDDCTANPVS